MELHSIRGGLKQDVLDKRFNIGVGISLGNKWFTPENIVSATKWALEHTKEYVIVYVADYIHAINLEVRNKTNRERALRLALASGNRVLDEVKTIIETTFEPSDVKRVHFAHWDSLLDEKYREKVSYLYSLYNENKDFQDFIYNLVKSYTSHENKNFSEDELKKLGTYIIEELPEIVCRTPINGFDYEAYVYPYDGEVVRFAEDLQKGIIFPQIKERILDTEPKIFLEVR